MRRSTPLDLDLDKDLVDDFGELDCEVTKPTPKRVKAKIIPIHRDSWTIVDAFNVINENLPKSQLGNTLYVKCAEAFAFLSNALSLTPVQCTIIAMLIENGQPMTLRQMGKVLGLSNLSMMTHHNDIEELFKARWVMHRGSNNDDMTNSYVLARGVVAAICENRVFTPEVLECENTQEFVEKLASYIEKGYQDDNQLFADTKVWIMDLIEANKELPLCKMALTLDNVDSISLLMLVIADYCNFNASKNEGLNPGDVQLVYPRETTRNFRQLVAKMQNGTHELFRKNLIEHKCQDGVADVDCYVATSYLKNEVLAEFSPQDHSEKAQVKMNGLKASKDITAKELFYNKQEGEQIERLKALLSQEQLPLVQERLNSKGMRTGVCILLHGGPGTGKTATAYELARLTSRDIIQVQVTDFKDKYVGESEAKLKKIFSNYRTYCKNSSVTPILLLNEGDAILSKRTTNVEKSVDQMSNSLQNILLEEMENLEGIMIVTTNLTVNLDKAFERRFIFKVKFDQPCKEVKALIWKALIEELDDDDAQELAASYDISGGEIENIARKVVMEYAITGNKPCLKMVKAFAREEKLNTNTRPVVGFNKHD